MNVIVKFRAENTENQMVGMFLAGLCSHGTSQRQTLFGNKEDATMLL